MKVNAKYFNPSLPGSFAGANSFIKNNKFKDKKAVMKELYKLKPYALHRPFRKRYKKRKFMVMFARWQIQVDLVDLRKYVKENDGYNYLLTGIDVFSKLAHAVPIKKKQSYNVIEAMKEMIQVLGTPQYILTDFGSEFVARLMKKYLESIGVKPIHTYGDGKASVVERFHSTLLSKVARYWTYQGNFNYTKVLPEILKSYNNTIHSTTKLTPRQVTPDTEHIAWYNTFEHLLRPSKKKPAYRVGQKVFISKLRNPFKKGYLAGFKDEVFTIAKVHLSVPPTYTLEESEQGKQKKKKEDDDLLKGVFYQEELSPYNDV